MKKVFLLTQFGTPHSWSQYYFENVAKLEEYGYYWKIFTPNEYKYVPKNVEIIPFTIEQYNKLMERTIGVNPHNYLENGIPHKNVSDFYVASGAIFQKYIKGFDFWGITNWDIVYGRLDHFLTDEELEESDIWTDDVNTINGIFCLFRNVEKVNNLFKEIPDWQDKFKLHQLVGTDEYDMTNLMKRDDILEKIRYNYPAYYPMHSHDRLEQHVPEVKLSMKRNGALFELFKDINGPVWQHARPLLGKEIPYFHFLRSKAWPNIA